MRCPPTKSTARVSGKILQDSGILALKSIRKV